MGFCSNGRANRWLTLSLNALLLSLGCGAKDRVGKDVGARDASVTTGGSHASAGASGRPSGVAGTAGTSNAQDPECDLHGIWIARLTSFSRDSIFSATQTASNWYYYEIDQSGADVTVQKALDCGIRVSGSADVTINAATTRALLHANDQTGRRGRFAKEGKNCAFVLDRFYSTRGVPRTTYLPADTSSKPDLPSIAPPLPTEQSPSGAEDWDDDGNPGIAFNVSGLGTRHVVQRDWNEFFSDGKHAISLNATEIVASARFDNQEEILAVSGGLGNLLRAGSTPATDLNHRVTFRLLGRDATDAAVVALQGNDDLETCYHVQDALPHDSAMQ